jgi:hypothetical protein
MYFLHSSGFLAKVYEFSICHVRTTCCVHLKLIDLISVTITEKSTSYEVPHVIITIILLIPLSHIHII